MKKALKVLSIIVLSLLVLLLFNTLNQHYPQNIVSKILRGLSVVVTPVLIALVIMYLINPFTQRLIKKHRFSKKWAIITTLAILLIFTVAVLGFVVWFTINQGTALYKEITDPQFITNIENWFVNNGLESIFKWLKDVVNTIKVTDLIGSANSVITTVIQLVAAVVLVPIFLWHFLNSQEVVMDKINENIPPKWRKNIIPIIEDSNEVIVSYFRSKVISMVVLFAMFILVYALLGISHIGFIILFALLISILDLIPYIGPTVGMIVPMIYIFSVGGVDLLHNANWHVNGLIANIILFSINAVIQFVQGNIIIPRLAGKEMHINSAVILVFMLFFGYFLGVWGIVLSIPLGGIMFVFWKHLKETGYFKTETADNEVEEIEKSLE